jgi:hypothetical protein
MYLPILFLASLIPSGDPAVPYRQPQLAAAHGQVAMTFGAGKTIYFASSSDQGKTFGSPVKVAEVNILALGRHRGPRLTILKDALLITAIVGEKVSAGPHAHGLPEDGNLVAWRSTDHGKSWSRTGMINDVPSAAREGLHAISADAKGNAFAAWLDLRDKGTKLYGSKSTDGGKTWSKNVHIYSSPDGTICQCCDPAVTFDDSGKVWVMWRNAVGGSRDLFVSASTDGLKFDTARKLGEGTWKINACPMDGGGIAIDGGQVTSAWRRESDVYLTEPGKAEKKIGTGKDVALARGKRGAYVAWTQGTGLELMTPQSSSPIALASEGSFVNLIALSDGSVIAAWESSHGIETKRVE